MPYEVKLHRKVLKPLERTEPNLKERIKSALRRLEQKPYEPRSGVDVARLAGTRGREDLYRLRVGDYRAIYASEVKVIYVTDLFHRGEDTVETFPRGQNRVMFVAVSFLYLLLLTLESKCRWWGRWGVNLAS